MMATYNLHERAASIVAAAGGELIGRTRLQKVAYLSQLAGFSDDFTFEYRHYGPFSEDLADAVKLATGLRLMKEEERRTDWGGWYSVFSSTQPQDGDLGRAQFIAAASKIGALELELAATATYLFSAEGYGQEGNGDPWEETANRKPHKAADGRLERAKAAYAKLRALNTPVALPAIA